MEYSSRGVGNAGLTTGIIGTALGVANSGLLPGLFGGANCNAVCHENMPVNRYELNMTNELAAKDAKIGLLESNIYTDQKIAALNDRVSETLRKHEDKLCEQAVYNAANTAAMNCMGGQIAQLYSLTKLVVPNTSVCPGWGTVTITPAAAPTTTG